MDVNDDADCLGEMRCIDDHREQARSYRGLAVYPNSRFGIEHCGSEPVSHA